MRIRLIQAPFGMDYGYTGAGKGPVHFVENSAEQSLSDQGFTVHVERLQPIQPQQDAPHASLEVNKRLVKVVESALNDREFPLVLGGMCDVSAGILAAFEHERAGVIWFDAHGDFNTPDTTPSGFYGGMPVAVLAGHCYQGIWSQVGGNSTPVPEDQIMLIGVRDLDQLERERLDQSAVRVLVAKYVQQEGQKGELLASLNELATKVREIYLHVDIDVLDPEEAPGVDYPAPGGPSLQEIEQVIRLVGRNFVIKAAALTAYNPDRDRDEKALRAGLRLISVIAESARQSVAKVGG